MAKKKLWNIFRRIKEPLKPLQSSSQEDYRFNFGPTLEQYSFQRYQAAQTYATSRRSLDEPTPSDDVVERMNRERQEQAKLSQAYEQMAQSREALNLTLKSQHRLLIATLITALVALIVGVISLFNKPPVVNIAPPVVNVQPPTVNVQPPDVKVNITP
jgi:hypothetical protein